MATLGDTSSAQSVTAAGLALLDDAAASDQRTTLGLGTLATQSGTFSGTSSGTNTGDQTNISGNAATVTTNSNLTGDITSVGNATTISAAKVPAKFGRAKHSAVVDYQLPGNVVTATSTLAPSTGTVYYHLCWTPTQIVLDQLAFNVTTGPAGNAKVRVGVTLADTDNQPSGAPLGDVEVAVATSFTGIKTATISATIPPGPFLICSNQDTAMTFRTWRANPIGGFIDQGLGSGSGIGYVWIAQTYPAANWPTPGLAWTSFTGNAGDHWIVCRVSTP